MASTACRASLGVRAGPLGHRAGRRYVTYAEGAQMVGDSAGVEENLDVAFAAARRCKASLQRVLAQLPGTRP